MFSLLVAFVLLAAGAACTVPLVGPVRRARPWVQPVARMIAALGFAVLALAVLVSFFVVGPDDVPAAIVVLGLYGLVAESACLAVAALVAVVGKQRTA